MELLVPMGVLYGPQEEYGRGRAVMPTMMRVDRKTTGTVLVGGTGNTVKGTNKCWG